MRVLKVSTAQGDRSPNPPDPLCCCPVGTGDICLWSCAVDRLEGGGGRNAAGENGAGCGGGGLAGAWSGAGGGACFTG